MRFTAEHDLFRKTVREVVEREVNPNVDRWEAQGSFPAHELFPIFGAAGLIGLEYDPAFGGQGADHSYTLCLGEELGRIEAGGISMALSVQCDMATPSLHRFGTDDLKRRYLEPACRGEMVTSIAVTEPDAGSDVAALRTRAVRDGDTWIINGTKLYITNGTQADWLCLLARTDEADGHPRRDGEGSASDEGASATGGRPQHSMSQIVVPTDAPGVSVSRKLDKLGNRSSDTAELSFVDARVPVANTIGEVGRGFQQQMQQFQNERMIACYIAVGQMRHAIERTVEYLRQRIVFGRPLLANQSIQFDLARLVADVEALRQTNHACAEAYLAGEDTTRLATIAKSLAGPLLRRVADTCLQYHGGIGYMEETWTARFFRDSRLLSIGGGADEVMLRTLARLDGMA